MAWVVLLVSACLEAVWASALSASDGLTRPGPSIVFAGAAVASMVGLAVAMKSIPVGTAYAVWSGLGAVLTVVWAAATGAEALSPLKVLFLAGIIGCAAGLKASEPKPVGEERSGRRR